MCILGSYSLSPCQNFVICEMGMTLIGDVDLVPTTSQVLPSKLFAHHIGRFPSTTYFVEEESRARRDASWNCCEDLKCTTCAECLTAVCAETVAPWWGRGTRPDAWIGPQHRKGSGHPSYLGIEKGRCQVSEPSQDLILRP